MNREDRILLLIGVALAIISAAGCATARPARFPRGPYVAHFDLTHCRYLPDGIRFRCKDVVFDPQVINVSPK